MSLNSSEFFLVKVTQSVNERDSNEILHADCEDRESCGKECRWLLVAENSL